MNSTFSIPLVLVAVVDNVPMTTEPSSPTSSDAGADPASGPKRRPSRADVRADIRAAAREVFLERGYANASLEMIAGRAGFSKGAVYSNFASKGALFMDLTSSVFTERASGFTAPGLVPSADNADAESDMRALALMLLKQIRDSYRTNVVFAEFRSEVDRDPQLLKDYTAARAQLAESLAANIEEVTAVRGLRLKVPALDAAVVVLALINGLSLEYVGRDGEHVLSVDTMARVLGALVGGA